MKSSNPKSMKPTTMKTAGQIAKEAEQALSALRDEAVLNGHRSLAAFLNKEASAIYWGAPTLDRSEPSSALQEWEPAWPKDRAFFGTEDAPAFRPGFR